MTNNSLFDRCRTNTNIDNDVFVGIRRKDDYYEVNFPLGYHRSEDEKGLRKDILSLINVLAKNTDAAKKHRHSSMLKILYFIVSAPA